MSASLALLIALALGWQVEPEQLDANRHMLQTNLQARMDFEAAQAALLPSATRLCADGTFFFGAFKFAEQEVPGAGAGAVEASFQQELYCRSEKHSSESAAVPGPSEAQQQAVLKATYGYLAAKDSNRFSDAYAMFSQRAKLRTAEQDWIAMARNFNAQAGAVRARRVTDISWYSDPPDAPEPGLYVAADLEGSFESAEFLCGYVVWKLEADGNFRLVREEQNFVERRPGAKLALLDRAPLRAQMGCKN